MMAIFTMADEVVARYTPSWLRFGCCDTEKTHTVRIALCGFEFCLIPPVSWHALRGSLTETATRVYSPRDWLIFRGNSHSPTLTIYDIKCQCIKAAFGAAASGTGGAAKVTVFFHP